MTTQFLQLYFDGCFQSADHSKILFHHQSNMTNIQNIPDHSDQSTIVLNCIDKLLGCLADFLGTKGGVEEKFI